MKQSSKLTLDEIGPRGGIGLLVAGFTADEGGMSAIDAMLPIVSPLFAVVDCAGDGVDGTVVFEGPEQKMTQCWVWTTSC